MDWKRVEPTEITKTGWRHIVSKNFILPDGNKVMFTTFNLENSHNADVIALTHDREVIVARQYRPGPESIMDEIPGGAVEEDETDFEGVAIRELKEETGYVPGKVTLLGSVYKDAYNNSSWHYYLAEDCTLSPDGTDLGEHEFIEIKLITIKELIENAKNGRMTDTEAVLLAYDKLLEIMED